MRAALLFWEDLTDKLINKWDFVANPLLKGVAPNVVLIHVLIGVTNNVLTKI